MQCDKQCFECKFADCIWDESRREYSRQYYQANKERIANYKKQYYQQHKERINAYNRKYYQENREYMLELQRKYRERRRLQKGGGTNEM